MDWPGNEPRPLLETPAINRFFCFLYLYMYFFVLTVPALPFVLTVQHNTNIQAPAGVEPAGPASNRPQTLALDRSPVGITSMPRRDSNPQPQQAIGRTTLAFDRSATGIGPIEP